MNTRRNYNQDFKEESVRYLLNHPEMTVTKVAESLGISRTLLSHWKSAKLKDEKKAFPGKGNPRDEEQFLLMKKLKDMEEENEILKKALAIFSKGQK